MNTLATGFGVQGTRKVLSLDPAHSNDSDFSPGHPDRLTREGGAG